MLESKLSKFSEREFCLTTSSGSAGIITALRSLCLPWGAEVIMPSICCPAVLSAIQLAGYKAVFADVDIDSLCMGPSQVEEVLTENTRVILAVHSLGRACPIEELELYAQEKGLYLIEDVCLAIGGNISGRPFGSFGDFSIYSFGYDKIIDVGGGGALLTSNEQWYKNAKEFLEGNTFFTSFSEKRKTYVFSALTNLSEGISVRYDNAVFLDKHLKGSKIRKLPLRSNGIYWRYACLFEGDRDSLVEEAGKEGIIISSHYRALHPFRTGEALVNAKEISDKVINFFVKKGTAKEYLNKVVEFMDQYGRNSC
ncbi:MAG: perosamine synthetase [Chlamydiales bacterium]|jgi:perosamine synthetase